MALINCPECGKEVSNKAEACIHCGYPLRESSKKRVLPVGTEIGYDCPKCMDKMIFEVISNNNEKTNARCMECNTVLTLSFDNIILTLDEYDSIYNDMYDEDIDTAINKIIQITNCDYDSAKKYVINEINGIHDMEKRLNIVHTKNRREKIEKQIKKQEKEKIIQDYQYRNNAECPYCHSKNTKKISTTSKAINTAVWGILGTKRFNQWHCNSCNSDF